MAIWQLSKRTLLWLKIGIISISILGFFCVLPALLLQFDSVQRWAARELSQELSHALHSPVRIERVGADAWQSVYLEGVCVQDSTARPALYATELKASLDLWELLSQGRWQVVSLRLFGLRLLVDQDSRTGRTNVQHIIEALSGRDDEPSTLRLRLSNVLLRDASLSYLIDGRKREQIDSLDLRLHHINIASEGLEARVEGLSLRTESGFCLSELRSSLKLAGDTLSLDSLETYLPNSYLNVPELRLRLGGQGLGVLESCKLNGLSLALKDLAPLYAPLGEWRSDTLRLTAQLERRGHTLHLRDVEASLANKVYAQSEAQLQLDSLGGVSEAYVDMRKFLLDASLLPQLPQYISSLKEAKWLARLSHLGQLSYQGKISLRPNVYAHCTGLLTTDLGRCHTKADLTLRDSMLHTLEATLSTSGFDLKPLLGASFGQVQGEVETKLRLDKGSVYPIGYGHLRLKRFDLAPRTYSDIYAHVEGGEQGKYRLSLGSKDKTFPLMLDGRFALRREGIEDIQLALKAHKLPMRQVDKRLEWLSLAGELELSSLKPDKMMGFVSFPHLQLQVDHHTLDLSHLNADMSTRGGLRSFRILSPWLRLYLSGQYEPTLLLSDALTTLTSQVPVLRGLLPIHKATSKRQSQATLSLELDSIPQALSSVLKLPFGVDRQIQLSAKLDTSTDSLNLDLRSPEVRVAQHRIKDFALSLRDHRLLLAGDTYMYGGTELIGSALELRAEDNKLALSAQLGRDSLGVDQGTLALTADLSQRYDKPLKSLKDLQASIQISPSHVRIHTSVWGIAPATIVYAGEALQVRGLSLSTEGRHLSIDGGIGTWAGDNALKVQLQNINLRYILEAAGVYFDMLDTDLTGLIDAKLVDGHVVANASVRSPHFYVNKRDVGAIDLGLRFTSEDLFIHLSGLVRQSAIGQSQVQGWIKPAAGAGLDLRFDAKEVDLSFVGSFMDSFLSKLEGKATGTARLHGRFEEGVTVSGETDIREGVLGIRSLGTEYRFTHHLRLDDERIHLDGITLYDDEGHSALLRGYVGHHCFGNFDIQLQAEDLRQLKVLQTSSPRLMPAYGKAYASGRATMRGSEKRLLVEVDLRSEAGTDVMLDFNTITAGRDESLMRFTTLRPIADKVPTDTIAIERPTLSSAIDLDLRLQITPIAKLAMRLGEDNNSTLRGHAEGLLQISAPSNAKPEVYGTLSIKDGEYLFNLQQLALKRFTVKEGGSLAFRGDAMRATFDNLNAVYALTANIADLDESISKISQRTNIPVHCLLRLSGEVSKPEVRFALELPGVDAEIERRVRSLLNSEDAVTRQMLYLIALGKFYTSDTETRTTSTTNNWTSVASSAISEQLSSLLGGLSESIRLGTSIKTKSTAFDDTDIELNFSGSWFGNRLTINGNVGYHDNPYLSNQYLGEFEFDYKLNRTGSLRLKGYNRYNSMYQYLRQSLLTQGFGILYRQRFDSLSDLLRGSKRKKREVLKPDSLAPP